MSISETKEPDLVGLLLFLACVFVFVLDGLLVFVVSIFTCKETFVIKKMSISETKEPDLVGLLVFLACVFVFVLDGLLVFVVSIFTCKEHSSLKERQNIKDKGTRSCWSFTLLGWCVRLCSRWSFDLRGVHFYLQINSHH